jgi:hypothetical protein
MTYVAKLSNAGGVKSLTRYIGVLAGNTVWNPWSPAGAFEPIAVATVPTGGLASVVFGGIPSTYSHLQVRFMARTARANQEDNIQLRFNADAGGNYAAHVLYGDGATAGAFSDGTSITFNTRSVVAAASATSGVFGAGVIDILDYASTTKNKTVRSLNGYDNNGTGQVRLSSGLWMNSATAINSITILSANAANISQFSSFALYGIKG